jgi:hypothetical protein
MVAWRSAQAVDMGRALHSAEGAERVPILRKAGGRAAGAERLCSQLVPASGGSHSRLLGEPLEVIRVHFVHGVSAHNADPDTVVDH